MTGIPVGYQDPVGILATRFRCGHIDLHIRSGSDYLRLLDIPVRSRLERILEVIRSGPGFSRPESDRNRIYSGTLPSLVGKSSLTPLSMPKPSISIKSNWKA